MNNYFNCCQKQAKTNLKVIFYSFELNIVRRISRNVLPIIVIFLDADFENMAKY